ncbi:hypothetical protein [Ruminococcus sp.]|uniref:hypothetical protein n=1 Tax=Ruminococcus sp. TaxID=41978 RepID=UPI0025E11C37|nr:hypothetical protein [Ruminococcus sp.]
MNSTKKRLISFICLIGLTLTGCGMEAATDKKDENASIYGGGIYTSESDIKTVTTEHPKAATNVTTSSTNNISETSKSISLEATTAAKNSTTTQKVTFKDQTDNAQQSSVSDDFHDNTERLAKTTNSNVEVTTVNTETPIPSDTAMHYENGNETTTCIPKTDPVVIAGDGNVLIIAEFAEQMGKQPLRISKEESEMLINMFNEIELEPIDQPVHPDDPKDEVFGGGYIMYIDGGSKITIRGNRNVMIDGKFYYDANNKSDALASKIGYVLYDYYGEP